LVAKPSGQPYSRAVGTAKWLVELTIEPNRELQGKILAYGQYLEVVQPQSLREQIRSIIEEQLLSYSDKEK